MTRISAALVLLVAGLGGAQAATQGPGPEDQVPYMLRYLVFQHQGYWDDPLDAGGPSDRAAGEARVHHPDRLPDESADNPMKPLWKKLADSRRYRPLFQGVAIPFAQPEEAAVPMAVGGQWPASIRPPFDAMTPVADRPMRVVRGQGWAPPFDRNGWGGDRVQGTLTFHKGRYAHLAVDLALTEDQRWMPWGLDRKRFFLRQSRRLLPNRFYYFDHPRFGVIARIEPLE